MIVICKKWEPRTTPNPGEVYSHEDFSIHSSLNHFEEFKEMNSSAYLKPDVEPAFLVDVSESFFDDLSAFSGIFIKKREIKSIIFCHFCTEMILAESATKKDKFHFCSSDCLASHLSCEAGDSLEFFYVNSFQGRCQEYSC